LLSPTPSNVSFLKSVDGIFKVIHSPPRHASYSMLLGLPSKKSVGDFLNVICSTLLPYMLPYNI
jgi:hypothetical protein